MKPLTITLIAIALITGACTQNSEPIIRKGAEPILVSNQFQFTEGPAADRLGNVYFTDQPNNRIMKWNVDGNISVFMENSGRANGLYFGNNGKLLACADENNQLWLVNVETAEVEILLADFEGLKLNGPNDLWVDQLGGIYFTDPYYKRDYWVNPDQVLDKERVYYIAPNGSNIVVAADQLIKPNGIIGTPDGKTLYVADIGDNKTYRYSINPDGTLSNQSLFCEMGSDGMTIDNRGNVYLTGKGVTVFDPNGVQIAHIPIDQHWTANVTFGGKNQSLLFITAMGAVYTLDMNVKGVRY